VKAKRKKNRSLRQRQAVAKSDRDRPTRFSVGHVALRTLLLCCLAVACSRAPVASPPTPRLKPQCGIASYYHATLAGNPTANGETYNPKRLTAAHKELPFGTIVTVRRRDFASGDGGKTVTVRINDRGPFVDGRIIDLSPTAAKAIGIYGEDGVAEVCLLRVKKPAAE